MKPFIEVMIFLLVIVFLVFGLVYLSDASNPQIYETYVTL